MKQLKHRWLLAFSILALSALTFSVRLDAQNYSISTNIAQWLTFGTVNIQGGMPADRHFTVEAGGAFNPFTFGNGNNQKYFRRIEFFAGGRWWPWFVNSGWFMHAYADWAKYSYGGIFTDKAYEGYAYGIKTGGGYALMLDKNINLEFGLGIFAGKKKYTEYSCTKCGKNMGKGDKFFVAPSDIQVGITIIF